VTSGGLPSFDLIVATVDRAEEPGRLLASLERQTHGAFRVLLVDQNPDDRLASLLEQHGALDVTRMRTERGLSRARNAALPHVRAELVAFPDDDCVVAPDLLERVARRFVTEPLLDGLTGRAADDRGTSSPSWARAGAELTRENLWNRAISFTIFLRSSVVKAVGEFDEELGLGSGRPWCSGEEIDYLVRAIDAGARIAYDPQLIVFHPDKRFSSDALRAAGAREGASVGYILRKHRYPVRTVGRMLVRPIGGTLFALLRRDQARTRFHLSTLRGRFLGYRSSA
jgi:glycosyltransferase involved in cell wall biosynthesis